MSAERDAFIKGIEAAILGVRDYEKAAKKNLRRHQQLGQGELTKKEYESTTQFWTSRAVCAHEIADGLQEHVNKLKKEKK